MGGRDSPCKVSRDLISILEFSKVYKALSQKIFLNLWILKHSKVARCSFGVGYSSPTTPVHRTGNWQVVVAALELGLVHSQATKRDLP